MTEPQHNESDGDNEATPEERRGYDAHTHQVAMQGGKAGCEQMLRFLGVDLDNPQEAQKDFHALRSYRKLKERVGVVIAGTLTTLGVTWIVTTIAEKIKS